MKTKTIAILAAVLGGGYFLMKKSAAPTLAIPPRKGVRPLVPTSVAPGETSTQTPGVAPSTTLSGTCFANHALASKRGMGSLG